MIFPLAVEENRCELGDYFTQLMQKNDEYLSWVYNFCAADVVKRIIMAAHNNITLIDLAYTEGFISHRWSLLLLIFNQYTT